MKIEKLNKDGFIYPVEMFLADKINEIIDFLNKSQQEEKSINEMYSSAYIAMVEKYGDKVEKKEEWDSREGQTHYCVRCECITGDTCTAKECVHTCGKDQPSKPVESANLDELIKNVKYQPPLENPDLGLNGLKELAEEMNRGTGIIVEPSKPSVRSEIADIIQLESDYRLSQKQSENRADLILDLITNASGICARCKSK